MSNVIEMKTNTTNQKPTPSKTGTKTIPKAVTTKRVISKSTGATSKKVTAKKPCPQKDSPTKEKEAPKKEPCPASQKGNTPLPETVGRKRDETNPGEETMVSLREAFITSYLIKRRNANKGTVRTYQKDYDRFVASEHFQKPVTEITEEDVTAFASSPRCLNRDMTDQSKPNAEPTIKKTLRLLKMLLEWLAEEGYTKKAPIPANLAMGSKSLKEKEEARKRKAETAEKEKQAAQKAQDKLEKTKATVKRVDTGNQTNTAE